MLAVFLALPFLAFQEKPLILDEGTHEFEITLKHPVETLESLFLGQPGVELEEGQKWPLSVQDHDPLLGDVLGAVDQPGQASVLRVLFKVPRSGRWSLRLEGLTLDAAMAVRDPKKGFVGIDDDGWYALNPLLGELKLRKGTTYELLLMAIGGGLGKVNLHAQRKPFDWLEQAKVLMAENPSAADLREIGRKKWEVLLADGRRQTPEEWATRTLENRTSSLRIMALEALGVAEEPGVGRALITYGKLLSLRAWVAQNSFFGGSVEWDGFSEECRTAFLVGLEQTGRESGMDATTMRPLLIDGNRPENYLGRSLNLAAAAEVAQLGLRLVLEHHGELPAQFSLLPANIGSLLDWSGQPGKAVRPLRSGLALLESHPDPNLNWFHYPKTAIHLGLALEDLGQTEAAMEAYQKAWDHYWPTRNFITGNRNGSLASWLKVRSGLYPIAPTVFAPKLGLLEEWMPGLEQTYGKQGGWQVAQAIAHQIQYFTTLSARISKLHADRGDTLNARKMLQECLAADWIYMDLVGMSVLQSAWQEARFSQVLSPADVILNGCEIAETLGDLSMVLSLLMRGAPDPGGRSLFGQLYLLKETGWRPKHEVVLMGMKALLETGQKDWMQAARTYGWEHLLPPMFKRMDDEGRWDAAHDVGTGLLYFLKGSIADNLISAQHPKVLETRHFMRMAGEFLGRPFPPELEFKDPNKALPPPVLTLWSPTSGTLPPSKTSFTVEGFLHDPSGPPDLRWRLDSGPWTKLSDLESSGNSARTPAEEGRWRFRFPLALAQARGLTQLELQPVSTAGLEGKSQTIQLEYQAGSRNLYVLAFGVADYESDALDLQWPVKDAEDLAAALDGQKDLFDTVKIEILRNDGVTNAELRRLSKSFLRQAGPDDTIVVFGAGHGIRDEDGEYYFLTADATPEDPYSGVTRHDIERLVTWSQLKSNRRILLLDTCQSGRGAADEASRGASGLFSSRDMDAALAGTGGGVYILAGSTEAGSALEAGGNGLFTAGILAALRGEGDTDGNGQVTVEELRAFVVQFVETKTDGRQRPTFPLIEGGEDFPLSAPNP